MIEFTGIGDRIKPESVIEFTRICKRREPIAHNWVAVLGVERRHYGDLPSGGIAGWANLVANPFAHTGLAADYIAKGHWECSNGLCHARAPEHTGKSKANGNRGKRLARERCEADMGPCRPNPHDFLGSGMCSRIIDAEANRYDALQHLNTSALLSYAPLSTLNQLRNGLQTLRASGASHDIRNLADGILHRKPEINR